MRDEYPKIANDFEKEDLYCAEAVKRILSHVLPPSFFRGEEAAVCFNSQLPIICWTSLLQVPFDLSFFLLCRFRPNAFRFFYEMVSRWLIPGKHLNALLQDR